MAHEHHDHHHDHDHDHHPPISTFGTAFALATLLNLALVAAQFFYGLTAHSVALLADAGHNLGDALGLLLAWGAHILARRAPSERFTYGLRSASILSALANGIMLLVITGAIAWEAVLRLHNPGDVAGTTVMIVAALGIAVNGLSAWLLHAGQKGDLNVRGAFLHLAADAGVSAGVVIAGAAILATGAAWIDPAVSLLISAVIVLGTWKLLREAIDLSMDAVPAGISAREVRRYLEDLPGVVGVHDLHIWAMSTTENALTVHLVLPKGHPGDAYLIDVCHELDHRFEIRHPTIQIEVQDAGVCHLEPAESL